MNEQIISAMRRYFPFPGQSLSPKEIEERQERIRRIAEEATEAASNSASDEETILSIIGRLKSEKTETRDSSQKEFIKGVIRKLREGLKR